MNRGCVNDGGLASLIRLPAEPVLDQETPLAGDAGTALTAWRARAGEVLTVVDPGNHHYRARLTGVTPGDLRCVPFARLAAPSESALTLHILHALPDKERFELVLEKLTELGVARLVPVETARSLTLDERDRLQRKSHRWPHLLRRAARQCRRAMLPELLAPVDFTAALILAAEADVKLLLDNEEVAWTLKEGVGRLKPESVALFIGPEGGFSREEVAKAQDAGVLPVRLGPRILRTETAAIAAATLVQGLVGDLG